MFQKIRNPPKYEKTTNTTSYVTRYVVTSETESYGSVQLMASSTCQTLGAKRWRTQTKPWRIENTQATEPQKIELNIREIIIDQLWCIRNGYICVIYDVCDCMCIYYFQSRHTVYISWHIMNITTRTTVNFNLQPSKPLVICFCHQKFKAHRNFFQQFSSRYIPFKQQKVSSTNLLHLGIPYSAKSASAAFGTCFLGLSESVQPEINRWEDVWCEFSVGFFCCTFAMFVFPDRFKRFQNI